METGVEGIIHHLVIHAVYLGGHLQAHETDHSGHTTRTILGREHLNLVYLSKPGRGELWGVLTEEVMGIWD